MGDPTNTDLSERQRNELEYHRRRAKEHADVATKPFSFEVLERPQSRWWNAYWRMYAHLASVDLRDKRTLVIGCGFGDDALRLARLGARVHAFDLSPESLSIARTLAARERVDVELEEMPAEQLTYPDDFFDCIVARDIFHHVDIPRAMAEVGRVARPGALLVVNEIYSHSITDRVRHSRLVEKMLYPRMQRHIYGSDAPYITEAERKLTEADVRAIKARLSDVRFVEYFNFLVTRVVPDRYETLSKADRLMLMALKPVAGLLAGRILFAGTIGKPVKSRP